jgi:hypothetical protein
MSQVNVIHYNVMLNTCTTTLQAIPLIKQVAMLAYADVC